MVGDERAKAVRANDGEPDVEAHSARRLAEDAPADKRDEGDDDDQPDVEAHVKKR
jgi:hypothetical protein